MNAHAAVASAAQTEGLPYADLVRSLLGQERSVQLRIRGGSMGYSIPPGSELEVSPLQPLQVGRIYLYREADQLIAHRLIRLPCDGSAMAIFRGEMSDALPEKVPSGHILGQVDAVVVAGRRCTTAPLRPGLASRLWVYAPAVMRTLHTLITGPRSLARRLFNRLIRLLRPSRAGTGKTEGRS